MAIQVLNRKKQIKEVACNLFREKGYAGSSMRDLAGLIGIEPASLYSHFKSKEEILHNICFGMASDFFNAQEDILNSSLSADIKLKKAIEAHIHVMLKNADASAVFLLDWRCLSEPAFTNFKVLRKRYEKIFQDILEEGKENGIFKNINVPFVIQTLFSSLNWLYDWQKATSGVKPETISKNFCDLIYHGIKKT